MSDADTIVALASAAGQAGIGVVRVSGPHAAAVMRGVVGRELPPRTACLSRFQEASGCTIDQGIALYFTAPRSYTGEDVLELQGHGGPAVLRLLVKRCLQLGARLAEPGEFTRRAFLNDKLDLTQAEAVADLIGASTEQAARSAMRSLQGEFSKRVQGFQAGLTEMRALMEATLDFPEEDLDLLHQTQLTERLNHLTAEIRTALATARQGSLLHDGLRVALIGPPNAGKSSIINALAKDDVAIVTAIPGTTRDLIRQSVEIKGLPVHLVDTAGLRRAQDPVEAIGISRTWEAISNAEVIVLVSDVLVDESAQIEEIRAKLPFGRRVIHAHNKSDLSGQAATVVTSADMEEVWISAKTGAGLDLLGDLILKSVGWQDMGEGLFMARERHVQALATCHERLEAASSVLTQPELVAEELRQAQRALSQLTGEVAPDDLLGEIFSRFCIGK